MPVLEARAPGRDDSRTALCYVAPGCARIERPVTLHLVPPAEPAVKSDGVQHTPNSIEAALIRGFDISVAMIAIVVLAPLMLLVAALVKMTSSGPMLFCQQRVGRDGALFPCLKFRSMVVDAQTQLDRLLAQSDDARQEWERDQKLRRDPRITPIGEFLRKTSLDELPQLFNILAGQMSVVGPRPIVEGEIVRYGSRFADYCSVRPGLTGLWQISGRNDVSYATRVRLDSLYVQRQSLGLNFAICIKTLPAILTSRGCY